jgi:hypothetical protein
MHALAAPLERCRSPRLPSPPLASPRLLPACLPHCLLIKSKQSSGCDHPSPGGLVTPLPSVNLLALAGISFSHPFAPRPGSTSPSPTNFCTQVHV